MDISKNVDMNQGIDRREAIKRVSLLFGGLAFGGSGLLNAVEKAHARAAAIRQVGTFTAQDVALLDEIADTILPDTKTPGAKAAHTGAFMALMVTDTYEDRNQATFKDGVQKLNAAGFMTKTPADRLAFLEQLDKDAKAYMDARPRGAGGAGG